MADVTGGNPPTWGSPFAVPDDFAKVYDHFGMVDFFEVDTAAALPMSGNWVKRRLKARDTGVEYEWSGTAWTTPGWTLLTLNSGWSPFLGQAPKYRVVDGHLSFIGRVSATSGAGSVIGVIPSALRPASAGYDYFMFTGWSDSHGIVQLLAGCSSGELVCSQGAGATRTGISLANVQFPVG